MKFFYFHTLSTQDFLWLCELDIRSNHLDQKLWNPLGITTHQLHFNLETRGESQVLLSIQITGSTNQEYFNEMRLMWIVEIRIKCCHLISTVCLICTELWNVIWIRELYWGLPHYRNGLLEGSELNCLKIKCVYINTWGKQTGLQT